MLELVSPMLLWRAEVVELTVIESRAGLEEELVLLGYNQQAAPVVKCYATVEAVELGMRPNLSRLSRQSRPTNTCARLSTDDGLRVAESAYRESWIFRCLIAICTT